MKLSSPMTSTVSLFFVGVLAAATVLDYQDSEAISEQLTESQKLMASMQESVTAFNETMGEFQQLDQAVHVLQQELQAVKADRNTSLGRQQTAGATDINAPEDSISVHVDSTEEVARDNTNEQIAACRAEASNDFLTDERDDHWAVEHENLLSTDGFELDSADSEGVAVQDVECRSHTCRVVMSLEKSAMPDPERIVSSRISASLPNAVWDAPRGDTVTVYLSADRS